MNMKKMLALLTVLALLLCGAAFAEETAPETQTGVYSVINKTGENVTEVRITDNLNPEQTLAFPAFGGGFLEPDDLVVLYFDIPANEDGEHRLTLSFKTESGREETFGTLSIEEVKIELLAADAMTGATPIAFTMQPKTKDATFTFWNRTNEVIVFLNLIDNEEHTAVRMAFKDGFQPGTEYTMGFGAPENRENVTLTLQFVTESGEIGIYSTLQLEDATIELLDPDNEGDPISFVTPAQ